MRVFLVLFLLLPFCEISAQQFNFTNIRADKGLPGSEVYSVLQDKQGYMWFCTNNGVSRYNGKEFATYTTADGLSDNTVFAMCEDRQGRIWFGSQNNEICYWYRDCIFQVPAGGMLRNSVYSASAVILMLYADAGDNLWINTSLGLFVTSAGNHYSDLRKIERSDSCNVEIRMVDGIHPIASGRMGSAGKADRKGEGNLIVRYGSEGKGRFVSFANQPADFAASILSAIRTIQGAILFSCSNKIYVILSDGRTWTKVFDQPVLRVNEDRNGGLWVGFLKGGIAYYRNGDLNSTPVHSLGKYSIGNVLQDRAGGVWATSLERGIFYTPSLAMHVYPDLPFLDDHITVLERLNGKVIINTFGNKIYEADSFRVSPSLRLQNMRKKSQRLSAFKVFDDTVYVGLDNETLIMDTSLNLVKNRYGISSYSSSGKEIIEAGDHSIWRFHGGGVFRLGADASCRSENYITSVRLNCGIAGRGSGLYMGGKSGLYDFSQGKFSRITDDSLFGKPVVQMKYDQEGALWIATAGAGVLSWKNNKVVQVSEREGLISDICTSVETDQFGNIWVGTVKGLSCIRRDADDILRRRIKNMDTRNGLNSDEVTRLRSDGPRLWVGTMSGITGVNINDALADAVSSPVYLRELRVNKFRVDTNLTLFSWDQNSFSFSLDGLNFSDGPKKRYRYRLTGYDTVWQETFTDEVSFTNLDPGDYVFYAEVANVDGNWSAVPAHYRFSIARPFWKQWWFILACCLVLAGALYFFIRYRTGVITKREEEKTRVNKLLAEYEMSALRAQMDPHFIFNAINSIQKFVLQKDSAQAYDYLVKFSKLIRSVLNNSGTHEIALQQEMETLSLYIELEQLRFEKAFRYQLYIDKGIDTGLLVIPPMLIQPYVENAIWHGLMPLKGRQGKLILGITSAEKMLKITVSDNGVGRKASAQVDKKIGHESLGMELSSKRVGLFGNGGPASVMVEDLYDEKGEPMGTSVEIILPLVESY